jgi:hypothetical protein
MRLRVVSGRVCSRVLGVGIVVLIVGWALFGPAREVISAQSPPSPPVISPGTGTYDNAVVVALSPSHSPPEALPAIYYTLDGTEPDAESTHYSGPLTITSAATLKARAFCCDGTRLPGAVGGRHRALSVRFRGSPSEYARCAQGRDAVHLRLRRGGASHRHRRSREPAHDDRTGRGRQPHRARRSVRPSHVAGLRCERVVERCHRADEPDDAFRVYDQRTPDEPDDAGRWHAVYVRLR